MPDNIYDAIIGMANDIKNDAAADLKSWCDYIANYAEQGKKENAELKNQCEKLKEERNRARLDAERKFSRELDEINENIDANVRIHKAAEKADEERIWKLQEENGRLREALEEALSGIDEFMTQTIYFTHGKDIERWRSVLNGNDMEGTEDE